MTGELAPGVCSRGIVHYGLFRTHPSLLLDHISQWIISFVRTKMVPYVLRLESSERTGRSSMEKWPFFCG
jgi:hypothetical protein